MGDVQAIVKTLTTITILIREGNFTRSNIFDVDEKEIFRGDSKVQIYADDDDDDDADKEDNKDDNERVGEENSPAMLQCSLIYAADDDDADKNADINEADQ